MTEPMNIAQRLANLLQEAHLAGITAVPYDDDGEPAYSIEQYPSTWPIAVVYWSAARRTWIAEDEE